MEAGLTQLRDLRSGNAVGQVPANLNAWYQNPPRQRLRLNRGFLNNELCDNLVRIGFKDSAQGQPIFHIDYVEEGTDFLQHYQFDAEIQVNRVAVHAKTLGGQSVALSISDHPLAQSPPLSGVDYPFAFTLGDNPGLNQDFWLYFEAMDGNDIVGINTLLIRYNGTSGGSSGSGGSGETEPGDREIESLTAVQTQSFSILADGTVQFHFELRHSPAPVAYVDWRWKRVVNGVTEYWKEQGNWTPSVRPLHRIGEAGAFSSRWHIQTNAENDLTIIETDLPFQDLGPFFGSMEDQAQIYVEVKLGYQDTSSVDYDAQADGVVYPLNRELPDTTVAEVEAGLSDYYDDNFHYDSGRAADLRVRVTKGQGELTAGTLRFRVKDSQGTSSPFHTSAFATVTENETHITAEGVTDPALLAMLDAPGQMELQAHPHGGTADGQKIELFVRDPAKGLTIRYHFRDHLGSSATSQTFRTVPVAPDAGEEAVAFQLAGIRFYNQGAGTTLYEPFGERFGEDVSGFDAAERPRYTGHEWDAITGFNYMKGRYQLTGRFNRPDPMRDWDWQNPHSINLYQYTRNNPINGWDPLGFEWFYIDKYDDDGNHTGKSWQYFEDTPEITVVENTYDESGRATGYVERTIAGIKELLQFNGDSLTWYHENGHTSSFQATSGRPGPEWDEGSIYSNGDFEVIPGTHPSRQWDISVGPIPEGQYSVNPQQIQRWKDLTFPNQVGSTFSPIIGRARSFFDSQNKVGAWPGGTMAWGHTRVQINPQSVLNPKTGATRSGFFIHGGMQAGSAGCIDLTSCNEVFFRSFASIVGPVPLYVQYPKGRE